MGSGFAAIAVAETALLIEFGRHLFEIATLLRVSNKTTFRLPPDVVEWLKHQAAHNITSMTTELVRVIHERVAQEGRAEKAVE